METLIVWLIVILLPSALFFTILYLVVKAAVRDGIIEAKKALGEAEIPEKPDDGTQISKTTCTICGKKYDIDYPKCPHCK